MLVVLDDDAAGKAQAGECEEVIASEEDMLRAEGVPETVVARGERCGARSEENSEAVGRGKEGEEGEVWKPSDIVLAMARLSA